ncbi:MAG: hypothetical protein WAO98_10405 [Alphaproteobacteria bacterium]
MSLTSVGSTWASMAVLQRFLAGVVNVVVLTIVSAVMCCVLLVGSFIAVYYGLLHYGFDTMTSALIVGTMMILVTGALVGVTILRLQHLRALTKHSMPRELPGVNQISGIADAFMDGLLNRKSGTRRSV